MTKNVVQAFAWGSAGLALCAGLPLLGANLVGKLPPQLWVFPPPLEIPTDYRRFSWIAFGLVVGPLLAFCMAWLAGRRPSYRRISGESKAGARPPWFGPIVAWTLVWWVLAWTRFDAFAPLQLYTFFPLWIGFVLVANGITMWRGGSTLMHRAPGCWALLFLVSAAFWWLFEWLNRFVRNWHYLGVAQFDAGEYALHATLCFSTVLPAVIAVRELLATCGPLQVSLAGGPRWRWVGHRGAGAAFVIAAVASLIATGAYPHSFYASLWAAPLLLASGAMILLRHDTFWTGIAHGDWREAGSWAFAALVCGFFWEMWNVHSAAKWIYTVPYVERWRLFEMPLLGYTGYLPFGLECALVVTWLLGRIDR